MKADAKTDAARRQCREFGAWLRHKREDAGKGQDETAIAAGISQTQLSRIEGGKSGTRRDTVLALSEFLDLDPSEACERSGFSAPARKDGGFDRSRLAAMHARSAKLSAPRRVKFASLMEAADAYLQQLESEEARDARAKKKGVRR